MTFVLVAGVDAVHTNQPVLIAAVQRNGVVVGQAALGHAVLVELAVQLYGLFDMAEAVSQTLQ